MTPPPAAPESLISARYHAPRGKKRLFHLGKILAERYLYPDDWLVGILGGPRAGKSTLIRGLFPGLELTNDDEGVNARRAPIFDFSPDEFFSPHTFHVDVRYEMAMRPTDRIVRAVRKALEAERRVVVEHFDLIHKQLGHNAHVLVAVGEEVKVYRPTVFGPDPAAIRDEAGKMLHYRLMAHSAEDLTTHVLTNEYGYNPPELHSEVRHGFVIGFADDLDIPLDRVEEKVHHLIDRALPIEPGHGNCIHIGDNRLPCTGKRIHMDNTGHIENFRLVNELIYDPLNKEYLLVGLVGEGPTDPVESLPRRRPEPPPSD